MSTYAEFRLDENKTILVEVAKGEVSGVIRAWNYGSWNVGGGVNDEVVLKWNNPVLKP